MEDDRLCHCDAEQKDDQVPLTYRILTAVGLHQRAERHQNIQSDQMIEYETAVEPGRIIAVPVKMEKTLVEVSRFYFSSEESSKVSSSFFFFLISLKITYKGQPSNNGGIKTNIIKHPHPLINTSSIS